nr:hypothetical protein BaRGS_007491 [Batillaria attramentaria]
MLEKLSLMYNNLEFQSDVIDPDCFLGCPNLNNLQLGHNFFNGVSDDKFNRLFGCLPELAALFLGSCGINRITTRTFAGMTSVKKIWLYLNRLTDIPDGAFDTLTNLTYLDLNDNRISVVREYTFSAATARRLRHLDVSGNPFTCSCQLLWFRNWLVSDSALFNRSYSPYTCSNFRNTSVMSFYLPEQTCLFSPEVNKFIVVVVTLLLLTMILVSSLYRYRWHIRLVLYEAFRGQDDARRQRLLAGHFRYDVFVCYDAENVGWVRGHLMPELEGRLGLQLCVHQRDFRPGKHIVENIVDSVQSSKKVLMLFSKHFARSPWCQFELNWCLSHVVENDDALVVVCLDDVSSRDLTPAMMAVLKTNTYIQWDEDPDAGDSFWGRLELALQEVLETVDDD